MLLLTEFMFCLLACQLSSLPSSVSPTTPTAVFPVRHLPPCFSSSLLETRRLASKTALERIHQPDQYSLENASSALLPSVLLCIVFIQLRMPFGGDHRTCFPNILQSPIRLAFCRCRTQNTKPPMHTQRYLSCRFLVGWGCLFTVNWLISVTGVCICKKKKSTRKLQSNRIEFVRHILWCSGQAAGNSRMTLWATVLDKKNASFIPRITTCGPAAQQG